MPSNTAYREMALQTENIPYRIEIAYRSEKNGKVEEEVFSKNADVLFALIQNLDNVTFSLDGSTYAEFSRGEEEKTFGDLWKRSDDFKGFQALYQEIQESGRHGVLSHGGAGNELAPMLRIDGEIYELASIDAQEDLSSLTPLGEVETVTGNEAMPTSDFEVNRALQGFRIYDRYGDKVIDSGNGIWRLDRGGSIRLYQVKENHRPLYFIDRTSEVASGLRNALYDGFSGEIVDLNVRGDQQSTYYIYDYRDGRYFCFGYEGGYYLQKADSGVTRRMSETQYRYIEGLHDPTKQSWAFYEKLPDFVYTGDDDRLRQMYEVSVA